MTIDPEGDADLRSAGLDLTWQEGPSSSPVTEASVLLWSGEVLLRDGQGIAGAFRSSEIEAKSDAASMSALLPSSDVFGLQVVCYGCAESKMAHLLAAGDTEYRRLNRFWMSPIRTLTTTEI